MKEKFRISDIFKKSKEKQQSAQRGIRFSPPEQEEIKEKESTEGQPSHNKTNLSFIIHSKESKDKGGFSAPVDIPKSTLYSDAVSLVRRIFDSQSNEYAMEHEVRILIERMVDLINTKEDDELLKAALADYLQPKDYLYYHVVNVCIFSLYIGSGLKYDRKRLIELGAAAFFHDIGITKYLNIINQPKKLSLQEYGQIKQHPIAGAQRISKHFGVNVFDVIRQEHERIDGSGYPEGLKDEDIMEYAQIVGLSDVYEAMIHLRPYRDKHSSLETIKEILRNKYTFAHKLVKILIEKIGIFPIGTIVQLNTKEIGQVVNQIPELPLRPVVNLMFDSSGKRLKSERTINLADSPTVYILGPCSIPKEEG